MAKITPITRAQAQVPSWAKLPRRQRRAHARWLHRVRGAEHTTCTWPEQWRETQRQRQLALAA